MEDRLLLDWRGKSFDLEQVIVRHRDDSGAIEFSITEPDGVVTGTRYVRKGPRVRDVLWAQIDFTADEPWTWEDRDFGLLVFHEATGTGPVKYRHRFQPRRVDQEAIDRERSLKIDSDGLIRKRHRGRTEQVAFSDLEDIRVKFEASGIWAPPSILVLSTKRDLAVFPLNSTQDVETCQTRLLPELRKLPGWDQSADAAIADACDYATSGDAGQEAGEPLELRAERPVWARPKSGSTK